MSEQAAVKTSELTPALLPDQTPTMRHLDPGSALAFRTPLQPYPAAADTKAGAILSVVGIMFTLLARHAKDVEAMLSDPGILRVLIGSLLAAFALLAIAAVAQAIWTIAPRFPQNRFNLAFFGDIATLSRDEYVKRVEALTHEEALDQMLEYNYTLSRICVEKFRHLALAVKIFTFAALSWFALMGLIFLRLFR